jgi:nucleolar pre-ribosomal-associated protein 1
MSKRPSDQPPQDGEDAYQKRQKIKHVTSAVATEDIQSSRQLQQLLAFEQDAGRAKHGIDSVRIVQ